MIKRVLPSSFECQLTVTPASLPSIRNRLTALKKNRGNFVKAQDVLSLYHAVVKQGVYMGNQQGSVTHSRPSYSSQRCPRRTAAA